MSRPKVPLRGVDELRPGTFAGVSSSTTVSLDHDLLAGRDDRESRRR